MGDFVRYFIEGMAKEAIDSTCAAMVNILKYVQGVHRVGEAVSIKPRYLTFFSDRLKTKGMCDEAVRVDPWSLGDDPDHFKTQKMCKKVDDENPRVLKYVPEQFKPQDCVTRQ